MTGSSVGKSEEGRQCLHKISIEVHQRGGLRHQNVSQLSPLFSAALPLNDWATLSARPFPWSCDKLACFLGALTGVCHGCGDFLKRGGLRDGGRLLFSPGMARVSPRAKSQHAFLPDFCFNGQERLGQATSAINLDSASFRVEALIVCERIRMIAHIICIMPFDDHRSPNSRCLSPQFLVSGTRNCSETSCRPTSISAMQHQTARVNLLLIGRPQNSSYP